MPVLQLDFFNDEGRSRRLTIASADQSKTAEEIKAAMETIIATGANENFKAINGARFVETDITEVDLSIE